MQTKETMIKLLDKFSDEFKKHKIAKKNIEEEIRKVRTKR